MEDDRRVAVRTAALLDIEAVPITDDEVVFRNYEGKTYRYPLKSTPLAPVAADTPFTEAPIIVY